MGPYQMDTHTCGTFIEKIYDLLVRGRDDLANKFIDANPNILPLVLILGTSFHQIPKDIDFYLVLLSYFGLFTSDCTLPGS